MCCCTEREGGRVGKEGERTAKRNSWWDRGGGRVKERKERRRERGGRRPIEKVKRFSGKEGMIMEVK